MTPFFRKVGVMKEKLIKILSGRYGADELSKAALVLSMVSIILSWFVLRTPLIVLAAALLGFCYFRMFSRNLPARRKENLKYLKMTNPARQWFLKQGRHLKMRKTHHIYSCPECGQKIRVPKGKGKICVTCPKCKKEFIKNS